MDMNTRRTSTVTHLLPGPVWSISNTRSNGGSGTASSRSPLQPYECPCVEDDRRNRSQRCALSLRAEAAGAGAGWVVGEEEEGEDKGGEGPAPTPLLLLLLVVLLLLPLLASCAHLCIRLEIAATAAASARVCPMVDGKMDARGQSGENSKCRCRTVVCCDTCVQYFPRRVRMRPLLLLVPRHMAGVRRNHAWTRPDPT